MSRLMMATSHRVCVLHENRKTALECPGLRDLGVTHVLNAAEGKWNNVLTGADYYSDMSIQYYGVEADDKPTFNISQHFCSATQFIHEALSHPQSESGSKSNLWRRGLHVPNESIHLHFILFQTRCWCTA